MFSGNVWRDKKSPTPSLHGEHTSSFCSFSLSSRASSSGVFIFSEGWAFISKPSSLTIMSYSSSWVTQKKKKNKRRIPAADQREHMFSWLTGPCLPWVSPPVCRQIQLWASFSPLEPGCSSTPDPASRSAPAPPLSAPVAPAAKVIFKFWFEKNPMGIVWTKLVWLFMKMVCLFSATHL